jgi:hypothetical protein
VPDEQVGLAEDDAPLEHLSHPRDDKHGFTVLLELGALVGLERILDGQVMQPELCLESAQQIEAWFVQADPGRGAPACETIRRCPHSEPRQSFGHRDTGPRWD